MKRNALSMLSAAAIFGGALLTTACESPDTQQRMDDYGAIVGDAPPPPEGVCESSLNDIAGRFVMALENNFLPNNPIFFDVQVTAAGANIYDFVFQPLLTYTSANLPEGVYERTPVGDAININGVSVGANGVFSLSFDHVIVSGDANSATGSEIEATLVFNAATCDTDRICGTGGFDLHRPLPISGRDAWFSASRIDDAELIMSDNAIAADCE